MLSSTGCIRNSISLFFRAHLQRPNLPTQISRDAIRSMSSDVVYTVDYLTDKLKKELDTEYIEIIDLSNCGCGMKFDAVLVSPKFENKALLQRQRLVNQILSEEMKHIHAFTMKTLTPTQWKQKAQ